MSLVQATRRRLAGIARLSAAVVGQLMNEIADATILHLDLLDLLVLVRVVAVRAALVELALRLPVVALHRIRHLAVIALGDRVFLLQLQHQV